MALNRFQPWLLACVLQLLVISAATAQEGVPAFAPGLFEDSDFQFFSQPDLTGYGSTGRPPTGWFGNVDYLIWAISAPNASAVGADHTRQVFVNNGTPGQPNGATNFAPALNANGTPDQLANADLLTTQSNSDSTQYIRNAFHSGARFDFGYICDDTDRGWLFSGFRLASVSQSTVTSNANMVIDDGSQTDTAGVAIQPANVYNGFPVGGIPYTFTQTVNGVAQTTTVNIHGGDGITALPLLYGWVDRTGGGTNGLVPDGFVDDLNHNNIFGPQGRDRGTVPTNGSNQTLATGTTLSGKPIGEGGADTLNSGGTGFGNGTGAATGPSPGQPLNGSTYQPIDYGDAVPLPVVFSTLALQYKDWAWGTEASRLWRLGTGHYGGLWEVFAGARYLDYGDYFGGIGVGGILDQTNWAATTENHIVAPQAGVRYRRKWSRMGFSLEARGATGANFQSTHLTGIVGSHLTQLQPVSSTGTGTPTQFTTVLIPSTQVTPAPTVTTQLVYVTVQPSNPGGGPNAFRVNQPMNLNPTGFNTTQHKVTFAPIGELRANWNYQLFNQVSINVGWTGVFVNGVGQASKQIEYSVPAFSFLQGVGLNQTVILTGLNVGLVFNR